jgi:hypothetical protein
MKIERVYRPYLTATEAGTLSEFESGRFNEQFPVQPTPAEMNVSSLFEDPVVRQYLRTHTTDLKLSTTDALNVNNLNVTLNALSAAGHQHDAVLVAQKTDSTTADLWQFLHDGTLPSHSNDGKFLQRIAKHYYVVELPGISLFLIPILHVHHVWFR